MFFTSKLIIYQHEEVSRWFFHFSQFLIHNFFYYILGVYVGLRRMLCVKRFYKYIIGVHGLDVVEFVISIAKVAFVTHIKGKNMIKNLSVKFSFYLSTKIGQVARFCVYL